MGLTVYISNKEIQAVRGSGSAKSVKVKNVYKCATPEGSILNGVITDPQLLKDALSEFWEKEKLPKKNVDLIINSAQMVGRITDCPILSTKKTLVLLEHEFMETERQEQAIVGFTELGRDKKSGKTRLFAEMTTFDYISAYDQIFSEIGVTLSGISSGIGKVVDLLEDSEAIGSEITILMMIDEAMLSTIFFLNGKYYYSSATRVFALRSSSEFGIEIAGVVSRLNQFSKSEDIEGNIQRVLTCGFADDELEMLKRSVDGLHIGNITCKNLEVPGKIKAISGDLTFRDMIFPIAGLLKPANHVNLLERARAVSPNAVKNTNTMRLALPYIIITYFLFIVTVVMAVICFNKRTYLHALNDHNNDFAIQRDAAAYDEEEVIVKQLSQQKGSLTLLVDNINSYPILSEDVMELVKRKAVGLAEIKFTGYEASTGILSMQAIADDVESTSKFIELLSKEDTFEYVDYTGYTFDQSLNKWIINMVCALSENAGK